MMRRRLTAWSKFLVSGLLFTAVFGAVGVYVIQKYPWQVVFADFSAAKESRFLTPWPTSALEDERQEKKKTKRFAKAEQARRANVQLRRMEVLNVPLFDVFLDSGVQLLPWEDRTSPPVLGQFPWPLILTDRTIGEENKKRNVGYVVLPSAHGSSLVEGLQLNAGEELRFNFPIIKNRRNLTFTALPMTPGTMRGFIGQYSWVRNFSDLDIHKPQTISIPINDATANQMRIICISTNVMLMTTSVSQWEKTGRLPIQVARKSPLWKASPELLNLTLPTENSSSEPNEATQSVPAPPEVDVSGSGSAASSVVPVASGPVAGTGATGEILEPSEQRANKQILVDGNRTTALGYNVLLLQLESIPREILENRELFANLAPNIAELMAQSVTFKNDVAMPSEALNVFQRSVLGAAAKEFSISDTFVAQHILESRLQFNLYARFRNYGYRVLGMAPAQFFGLSPRLSWGKEFPNMAGRWLDGNDWNFAARKKELDEQAEPASGLDAIFQTNNAPLATAVTDSDALRTGQFLGVVAGVQQSFPDWHANELFLPDSRDLFLPRVIDNFQRWTKDNPQTRFLAHIYFDSQFGNVRPSLKDFFKVVRLKKLKVLTNSQQTELYARVALLDRSVGQMLENLTSRKIEHRTVVALMIPPARHADSVPLKNNLDTDNEIVGKKRDGGTFVLKVPGLLPATNKSPMPVDLDDTLATLMTLVGIPMGKNLPDTVHPFDGHFLEEPRLEPAGELVDADLGLKTRTAMKQFSLFLRPGKTGCLPFEWKAESVMFGLRASHPIYELPNPSELTRLKIFPCAVQNDLIEISWFQENEVPQSFSANGTGNLTARESIQRLGGFFTVDKTARHLETAAALPVFLFGTRNLRLDSLPLTLPQLSKKEFSEIFDLEKHEKAKVVSRILEYSAQSEKRADKASPATVLFVRSESKPLSE